VVHTTPLEVHNQRKFKVQQIVELMKSLVPQYDTLLAEAIKTWMELEEYEE